MEAYIYIERHKGKDRRDREKNIQKDGDREIETLYIERLKDRDILFRETEIETS